MIQTCGFVQTKGKMVSSNGVCFSVFILCVGSISPDIGSCEHPVKGTHA